MDGKLLLFFHPFRITNQLIFLGYSSSRLGSFLHLFNEYFSSFLEQFLQFSNDADDPIQRFGRFSSASFMKNEKEILIRCIYLITLKLLRDSEILQQVWFVFGFLLHNDSFLSNTLQTLICPMISGLMH